MSTSASSPRRRPGPLDGGPLDGGPSAPPAVASTTDVAPIFCAKGSRAAWVSLTTTSTAPAALATAVTRSPIGPAPVTSTRSPTPMPAFHVAQMATESGSSRAPASSETCSGSG